ncbi:MAG: alanine/glycine:cation symporter family protein [Christensenellaceae bacterium]
MNVLLKIISFINDNILWGVPMILAIFGTGLFISIRTKFLQVRRFKASVSTTIVPTVKSIGKKKKYDGNKKTVSQFEAFSAAISGTVGTGNIVGVATALLSGGPGAIFWMWFSAFFGLVTNYSENVLGIYFRKKNKNGEMSGGPMYYLSEGLNLKWLALIFAACCSLAAVGMGMVQSNSISGTIQNAVTVGNDKIIAVVVGVIVAVFTSLIVIGGIKRIGKVASLLVPFMALLFIIMAVIIIVMNITAVPQAVKLIFVNAFSFKSVSGGFLGYMISTAMRYGFARGIFSNEAGLGSSVIAHSASDTKEPVEQGLWGIFEVFFDTFIICTLTALTILTVFIKSGNIDFTDISQNVDIAGAALSQGAFTASFGSFGTVVFSVILPLFALTTILAWAYYGEKSVEFVFGEKYGRASATVFKVLYIILLVVGAVVESKLVWSLDDMFNALMAVPNLIGLILLSGLIVRISKNYFDRKNGASVEPMLSFYKEENEKLKAEIQKDAEIE